MNCPKCGHDISHAGQREVRSMFGEPFTCCSAQVAQRKQDGFLYYEKCQCIMTPEEIILNVADQTFNRFKHGVEIVIAAGELQPRHDMSFTIAAGLGDRLL